MLCSVNQKVYGSCNVIEDNDPHKICKHSHYNDTMSWSAWLMWICRKNSCSDMAEIIVLVGLPAFDYYENLVTSNQFLHDSILEFCIPPVQNISTPKSCCCLGKIPSYLFWILYGNAWKECSSMIFECKILLISESRNFKFLKNLWQMQNV